MGVYYLLVNKDLWEYIDAGDLNLGIKEWSYTFHISTLLGYLIMDEYNFDGRYHEKYNPDDDITEGNTDDDNKVNFYFKGHWSGCNNIQLVSEYQDVYADIGGYSDKPTGIKWTNITKPLAKEWNTEIKEWYSDVPDMTDWMKQHLYNI